MNPLQLFYSNENERQAVYDFFIATLGELAVEKAFDGKETKGIQEAKECIDNAFTKLEELFAKKKPQEVPSPR